jgi:hypothetical protein
MLRKQEILCECTSLPETVTAHTRSRVRGGVSKEEDEGRELHHSPGSHPTQGNGGGREGIGVDVE